MHVKVLDLLVVIRVVTGFISIVQILDYSNTVLKEDDVEVYGDNHDVSEWTELSIRCLVTRLIGCAVSSPVDKRLEVIAASSATWVIDKVSGIPLSGL